MRTRSQTKHQIILNQDHSKLSPQVSAKNVDVRTHQQGEKIQKGEKIRENNDSYNEDKFQTSNKKPRKSKTQISGDDQFFNKDNNGDSHDPILSDSSLKIGKRISKPKNKNQNSSENKNYAKISDQNTRQLPILIELGQLIKGTVIKRPSAQIRTPYVADVNIDAKNVLAHTPALDCAGMIVPNATVYMTETITKDGEKSTRKTTHSIRVAVEPREEGSPPALVGCHPHTAEQVAFQALEKKLIPELGYYEEIEREKKYRNTRVDFVLKYSKTQNNSTGKNSDEQNQNNCDENEQIMLLEVKNVVCADYPEGGVPEGRGKIGVYTSDSQPYERTAIFPHGAKKPKIKVVSDRAIKQINDLIQIQNEGTNCAVLFIVSRDDCAAFRPCHEADMLFAQILLKAKEQGVLVLAHSVVWDLDGDCCWGRPLPVKFDAAVKTEDFDYDHLEKVLEFNADQKNTRQPPKKKIQN